MKEKERKGFRGCVKADEEIVTDEDIVKCKIKNHREGTKNV